MMRGHLYLYFINIFFVQCLYSMTCNVRDYGAVGDNKTDDTASIQKAIDACTSSNDSSSTLLFPSNYNFLSFPLAISHAANLTITIDSNSILQAQPNITAWPIRSNEPEYINFFTIGDSANITLTGSGLINGIYAFKTIKTHLMWLKYLSIICFSDY